MEVAGLAVGVVGLTALLEGCINAFTRFDTYRHYGRTSRQLETRFKNQKFLLEQWGIRNGLATSEAGVDRGMTAKGALPGGNIDKLDKHDRERLERISDTLLCVREALETINERINQHDKSTSKQATLSLPLRMVHDPAQQSSDKPVALKRSPLDKLKWAVGGKERLVEEVEWFENMVQTLEALTGDPQFAARIGLAPTAPSTSAIELLRSWINGTSPSTIYEHCVMSRVSETCSWIFDLDEYKKWGSPDTEKNILWLNAPPGYGKSVTAAAIAESLKAEHPNRVLTCFCSTTQDLLRKPSNILRFCLADAIAKDFTLFRMVEKARDNSHSQTVPERELWSLFAALAATGYYIVIDGFDECEQYESEHHQRSGTDRQTVLQNLLQTIKGTSSRLLLLSRNEDDIRSALYSTADGILTEYHIERANVQPDIEKFAAHQIKNLNGLARQTEALRGEIAAQLIQQSDGMFLWVRLQSTHLAKARTTAHLKHQMASMPPGLNSFYERDWSRIQATDEFERSLIDKILRWILFAIKPLNIMEVFEIVFEEQPDNGSLVQYAQEAIIDPCRPFLSLQANAGHSHPTVLLAHSSMKDFLESKLGASSSSHGNALATICIDYMSSVFEAETNDNPEDILTAHAFLRYAAQNWMLHMKQDVAIQQSLIHSVARWFGQYGSSWINWRNLYEYLLEKDEPMEIDEGERYFTTQPGGPLYYAAYLNLIDVVKSLLLKSTDSINEVGGRFGTALEAACNRGSLPLVQLLLGSGADVNINAGIDGSALNAAIICGKEDMVSLLLQQNVDLSITDDYERTALRLAARQGRNEILRRLLDAGCTAECVDRSLTTPLHAAACSGHAQTMKLLWEAGHRDIHSTDDRHFTPLHGACSNGMASTVFFLLEHGAITDVNRTRPDGMTPLHSVVIDGRMDIVKMLLMAGASESINVPDGLSWTPFLSACHNGAIEMAQLLLDHGADAYPKLELSRTAVHAAAGAGHAEMLEWLFQRGAGVDIETMHDGKWKPLHTAASFGHVEAVKKLLAAGATLSRNVDGEMPLHTAARNGHPDVVEVLLKAGAHVNISDDYSWTALNFAAKYGHVEVVRLLLASSPDLNTQTKHGETPCWQASCSGHFQIVRALCAAGADITLVDNNGKTPFCVAAEFGHEEVIKVLLEFHAEIDVRDTSEWTPLHYAVRYGQGITAMLLDAGADIHAMSMRGYTPLVCAAWAGQVAVTKLLLDAGADVQIRDSLGWTPLNYAVDRGHTEVVKLLLDAEADLSIVDETGRTPLASAAIRGFHEIVPILLHKGADINERSEGGWTPLLHAIGGGHDRVVDLLLASGASVSQASEDFWTPITVACALGQLGAVMSLVKAGADAMTADGTARSGISYAIFRQHTAVVEYLLSVAKTPPGHDALVSACDNGDVQLMKTLLQAGAPANTDADATLSVLRDAAEAGHAEIVQLLFEYGAAPDNCGSLPTTPLYEAASAGHLDIVRLLLEHGADVHHESGRSRNALLGALVTGHEDIADLLRQHGARLDFKPDHLGRTLLHLSAILGLAEGIETALQTSFDVNSVDNQNWTALHWAAYFGMADSAEVLLQHGARQEQDWEGRTPYDIALLSGVSDASALLKQLAPEGLTEVPTMAPRRYILGRTCDGCAHNLVTARYKCTTCVDYDLCFRCIQDAKTIHPDHHLEPGPEEEYAADSIVGTPKLSLNEAVTLAVQQEHNNRPC